MTLVFTLLLTLAAVPFESNIDRAFSSIQTDDWAGAAAALDEAFRSDPDAFAANNFHYLRGRIAEMQNDWPRARDEFVRTGTDNPLYAPALWHAARAAARLHDDPAAAEALARLPLNFPGDLKAQIAREAGGSLALAIYRGLTSREARYERAKATGDRDSLWELVRENKDDDAALDAARVLAALTAPSKDAMVLADVFVAHRQFEDALPLYRQAALNEENAAEARYQIARIHFLEEKYQTALDEYRSLAGEFEATDWQKEAEYQIASCYWRLGDYPKSEQSYLAYIRKYGRGGMEEAATRNLVDVYRVMGENQKALTTLDGALAKSLSVSTRQVFLFTKAKILYTQKRYSAALLLFQQLRRSRLRTAPGSATAAELDYLQALCQLKLGNKAAAAAIWKTLARDEFSYYGQRSAQKLGTDVAGATPSICSSEHNPAVKSMELELTNMRHTLRSAMDSTAGTVSELVFLRLWDEAAYWLERDDVRTDRRAAAQISFLGGRYDRAISLAGRLPKTVSTQSLLYPAGYQRFICEAARSNKIDPLWLNAIIWQESKYDPTARSGAAARGLMQFIPETALAVGSTIGMPNLGLERLYDPAISIQLGAAYWSSLLEQMKSPEAALAAYNGGPDNVQRWLRKSADPELFVADIGFSETKKYVMSVFAARAAYGSLAKLTSE